MTAKSLVSYLTDILNTRVYDVARETPLDHARLLSKRLENHVWLKREDQQSVFCYKIRGAYNKMMSLSAQQLAKGVVVASAGNHAIGVAMSAHKLGTKAVIIMPLTTPAVKVEAVERWGADVRLVGDNFDAAYQFASRLADKERRTMIHPFDDPAIIAGQGTVGLEILKQSHVPIDAVFLPVGGGGLIAGVATYIKQVRPEVKIIGVEPEEADAMYRSLKAGRRVKLREVGIFADGVAVKQVGKETFRLCRQTVDQVIRVNTDEICAAIKDTFEDTRTLVEPSGALAVAGIKRWLQAAEESSSPVSGKHLVAVSSGANVNFDRLRHISERAEIGERREAILAVTIPEKPGSFRRFCASLGHREVSEFNYRYSTGESAHIFVGVQIKDPDDIPKLVSRLESKGFPTLDLTDNEMAKIHARHMVGGRASGIADEKIYSFEFPERIGALKNFLDQLGTDFNITLFHYRNHGADYGRVLCGIRVPQSERKVLNGLLKNLGYRFKEETDNPVYKLFLA
ncbi:MAG: threonine ammonia-lyase, biosynthetic [bacterium]